MSDVDDYLATMFAETGALGECEADRVVWDQTTRTHQATQGRRVVHIYEDTSDGRVLLCDGPDPRGFVYGIVPGDIPCIDCARAGAVRTMEAPWEPIPL